MLKMNFLIHWTIFPRMAYFTYITKTLFEMTLCVVTIYCDSLFQDLAVTVHTFVVQTWTVQSMSATQKDSPGFDCGQAWIILLHWQIISLDYCLDLLKVYFSWYLDSEMQMSWEVLHIKCTFLLNLQRP